MNFATILAMIEEAVALLPTAEAAVTNSITSVKKVLNDPAVKTLEKELGNLLHFGQTPTAVVVTPKAVAAK